MGTNNLGGFGFPLGGTIQYQQLSVTTGISELKKKKEDLIAKKPKFPKKAGSGDVANEVEMIGKTYEDIYEAMLLLFENTIEFLNNAEKSLVATDKALSKSFIK